MTICIAVHNFVQLLNRNRVQFQSVRYLSHHSPYRFTGGNAGFFVGEMRNKNGKAFKNYRKRAC